MEEDSQNISSYLLYVRWDNILSHADASRGFSQHTTNDLAGIGRHRNRWVFMAIFGRFKFLCLDKLPVGKRALSSRITPDIPGCRLYDNIG